MFCFVENSKKRRLKAYEVSTPYGMFERWTVSAKKYGACRRMYAALGDRTDVVFTTDFLKAAGPDFAFEKMRYPATEFIKAVLIDAFILRCRPRGNRLGVCSSELPPANLLQHLSKADAFFWVGNMPENLKDTVLSRYGTPILSAEADCCTALLNLTPNFIGKIASAPENSAFLKTAEHIKQYGLKFEQAEFWPMAAALYEQWQDIKLYRILVAEVAEKSNRFFAPAQNKSF